MMSLSELLQISCKFVSDEVEVLGIALRIEATSFHLSNTATKHWKLKQDVDSCWQHIDGAWNSISGIFFVPNSVPNRRKFHALKLLALLILCSSCGNVDCHLHREPQNVAERVGKQVYMSFASNNTVHPCQEMVWTHYTAHTFVPTIICMRDNVSPLVSQYISIVDLNDGNCTLEIKTRASAEGTYECISTTTGKRASASLIILAGYPECHVKSVVNETGEYYNITCWVEYFGDWAPTMEWIKMIGQNSANISSDESFTSDQSVSSNLVVPRNVSSSYKCILKFNKEGKTTKTTATNVPDYEWTSLIFGECEGETRRNETTETMPCFKEINSGCIATVVVTAIAVLIIHIGMLIGLIWYRRKRLDTRAARETRGDDGMSLREQLK